MAALASYEPKTIAVEGLDYREGLNAVQISGGVAGNVIPDAAAMHVNYRFAPDKTLDEAVAHVREVFAGYELDFVDLSPAARPGLDTPLAASLIEAVGQEASAEVRLDGRGAPERDRYSRGELRPR